MKFKKTKILNIYQGGEILRFNGGWNKEAGMEKNGNIYLLKNSKNEIYGRVDNDYAVVYGDFSQDIITISDINPIDIAFEDSFYLNSKGSGQYSGLLISNSNCNEQITVDCTATKTYCGFQALCQGQKTIINLSLLDFKGNNLKKDGDEFILLFNNYREFQEDEWVSIQLNLQDVYKIMLPECKILKNGKEYMEKQQKMRKIIHNTQTVFSCREDKTKAQLLELFAKKVTNTFSMVTKPYLAEYNSTVSKEISFTEKKYRYLTVKDSKSYVEIDFKTCNVQHGAVDHPTSSTCRPGRRCGSVYFQKESKDLIIYKLQETKKLDLGLQNFASLISKGLIFKIAECTPGKIKIHSVDFDGKYVNMPFEGEICTLILTSVAFKTESRKTLMMKVTLLLHGLVTIFTIGYICFSLK